MTCPSSFKTLGCYRHFIRLASREYICSAHGPSPDGCPPLSASKHLCHTMAGLVSLAADTARGCLALLPSPFQSRASISSSQQENSSLLEDRRSSASSTLISARRSSNGTTSSDSDIEEDIVSNPATLKVHMGPYEPPQMLVRRGLANFLPFVDNCKR